MKVTRWWDKDYNLLYTSSGDTSASTDGPAIDDLFITVEDSESGDRRAFRVVAVTVAEMAVPPVAGINRAGLLAGARITVGRIAREP